MCIISYILYIIYVLYILLYIACIIHATHIHLYFHMCTYCEYFDFEICTILYCEIELAPIIPGKELWVCISHSDDVASDAVSSYRSTLVCTITQS